MKLDLFDQWIKKAAKPDVSETAPVDPAPSTSAPSTSAPSTAEDKKTKARQTLAKVYSSPRWGVGLAEANPLTSLQNTIRSGWNSLT